MAAIVIAKVQVTDAEKYEGYKPLAKAAIEAFGGRYIVRGAEPTALEGAADGARYVVVEFDSVDVAQRFYESEQYLAARTAREGAADLNIIALTGV